MNCIIVIDDSLPDNNVSLTTGFWNHIYESLSHPNDDVANHLTGIVLITTPSQELFFNIYGGFRPGGDPLVYMNEWTKNRYFIYSDWVTVEAGHLGKASRITFSSQSLAFDLLDGEQKERILQNNLLGHIKVIHEGDTLELIDENNRYKIQIDKILDSDGDLMIWASIVDTVPEYEIIPMPQEAPRSQTTEEPDKPVLRIGGGTITREEWIRRLEQRKTE